MLNSTCWPGRSFSLYTIASFFAEAFPALRSARPFGLAPLPWFLIGPVTLFSIAAVAFVHERRTVRFENEWSKSHREPGT